MDDVQQSHQARGSNRLRFHVIGMLIFLLGVGFLTATIVKATNGGFFYSLDDPYIHLALAENLVRGHYGINLGETSSPSSSILYPFILAFGLLVGAGEFGPLIINLVAMGAAVWIMSGLIFDALCGPDEDRFPVLGVFVLPVALISFNAIGLPLTGMEHSLHLLISIVILTELLKTLRTGQVGLILITAIILCPFIRFEGLALSGAAIGVLALRGHWKAAILMCGTILAGLLAYAAAMQALGLPPLPSSVMVKSDLSAAATDADIGGAFAGIAENILGVFQEFRARFAIVAVPVLILGAVLPVTRVMWPVAMAAALAGLAHLFGGDWGWMSRYEAYLNAFLLAAILIVWRPVFLAGWARIAAPIGMIATLMLVAPHIGATTLLTPTSARWIYGQQHQLHRLVTEYFPETIAVHDLGWVSYQNDGFVLDLWGLGSERARRHILNGDEGQVWIDQITIEYGAVFAAVFDNWFEGDLPADWCRIGELHTPRFFDQDVVALYLIDPTREDDMRAALAQFNAGLPDISSVQTFDCP